VQRSPLHSAHRRLRVAVHLPFSSRMQKEEGLIVPYEVRVCKAEHQVEGEIVSFAVRRLPGVFVRCQRVVAHSEDGCSSQTISM
jgi:hypothetical protein